MEEDANQPKKGILRNKSEDKHQYVSLSITINLLIFLLPKVFLSPSDLWRVSRISDLQHARPKPLHLI